jgi:hypothetical protein
MIFLLIVIAALLFFILLFLLSIDDRLLNIETYTRLLSDYRHEINSLLKKLKLK